MFIHSFLILFFNLVLIDGMVNDISMSYSLTRSLNRGNTEGINGLNSVLPLQSDWFSGLT